jgi:hypothetical protein
LPGVFRGPRHASTAIFFMLAGKDFSALHRLGLKSPASARRRGESFSNRASLRFGELDAKQNSRRGSYVEIRDLFDGVASADTCA